MKIVRISKRQFDGKVYNFHCLPSENYFSEGILVHNCYKNNKNIPATNMTLDTFKQILSKMPKTLTQIAFGITGVQTNPDFIPMMKYCREQGVVPNFTLSGIDLTDELAYEIALHVGGLAVSAYQSDKSVCYNTVEKFANLGVKQTNIHIMVSKETLDFVYEVLSDIKTEKKLKGLNAIVFLAVKPKGRAANNYHPISVEDYTKLTQYCMDNNIQFGFDSCSAIKFGKCLDKVNTKHKKQIMGFVEPCESFGMFSAYINVEGKYFPCSFCEKSHPDFMDGIDILNCSDFLKDVWYSKLINDWRKKSLEGNRNCPIFEV